MVLLQRKAVMKLAVHLVSLKGTNDSMLFPRLVDEL